MVMTAAPASGGRNVGECLMHALEADERRISERRLINLVAKIQVGTGSPPRDCVIADISTGGVKLHVEGFEVPDDFVLILSGDGVAKACNYQVVWRIGHEIGARFVSFVRSTSAAPAPSPSM
jgi:hypothetical protein